MPPAPSCADASYQVQNIVDNFDPSQEIISKSSDSANFNFFYGLLYRLKPDVMPYHDKDA